jgi:site-specific recombinase XerC
MNTPASTCQRSKRAINYNGGVIRQTPSGRWQAEVNRDYKRRRKTADSQEDCEAWIDLTLSAVARSGSDALKLTSPQLNDASRALQKAGERVSLLNAVEFWIHHHPAAGAQSSVEDFYEAYYAELRDIKQVSADHLKNTRRYCKMLVDAHGDHTLAQITTEQLQAIIDTMTGVKDSTRRKARDSWRALFNAAIDRKLVVENPAREILNDYTTRMPSRLQKLEKQTAIGILTPADTRSLFEQMRESRPEMVAGLALGFFAGIRTEEISRVFWHMIDLENAEIHLPAEVSKTAESRIIPLEENAIEWLLQQTGKKTGRVLPGDTDYRAKRRFEKARLDASKAAGVEWKQNAARHSFGSYHARLRGSEHETFTAMGHSDIRTFRKHYRNTNITQAECKAFWSIRPEAQQIKLETG